MSVIECRHDALHSIPVLSAFPSWMWYVYLVECDLEVVHDQAVSVIRRLFVRLLLPPAVVHTHPRSVTDLYVRDHVF